MVMPYFWKKGENNLKRTLRIASPLVFLAESHLREKRRRHRAPRPGSADVPPRGTERSSQPQSGPISGPGWSRQESFSNTSQHVFPVTLFVAAFFSYRSSVTFAGYRLTGWSQVDLFDFC